MTPDEDQDLILVTLFALSNDEFRQEWDKVIRETADQTTAAIAGARMAGEVDGTVEVWWDGVNLPVPADIGVERTRDVFMRVVMTEVGRRVEAMTSPGSFG